MSDVEKYGLFAVVFVGGLLLVIALQGGFSGEDPQAAAAGSPVVITGDVPLSAPTADASRPPSRVRVKSIMPDTPFEWSEPPIAYPGERASALPESAGGSAAPSPAGAPMPAGAPQAAGIPVAGAAAGTHVVVSGDTLSAIAARYLGNESRWKELVKLNPGLDPKNLKLGQQVRVSGAAPAGSPAVAAAPKSEAATPKPAAAPAASGSRTHTVVKGDTLGAIAKKYLGSTARADDLYAANRDVLKSKDDLALGQVLRIP
jgi:nucleoid-associated protein YgaU